MLRSSRRTARLTLLFEADLTRVHIAQTSLTACFANGKPNPLRQTYGDELVDAIPDELEDIA